MNPQDSNPDKELKKKADIKDAIQDYQSIQKTDKALNDTYGQFINSDGIPEAVIRLAQDLPEGVIKSLAWKFVKVINSILSKSLFYLGIELGSSDEDITEKAREATKKVKLLAYIMYKTLEDPEVKENVRQLAIELNNSVLRPFLEAALVTMDEMNPAIDVATDKLAEKGYQGVRKVIDSAGNAVLSGLGTVPYVGNILNATDTIANVLMGVQAIADTAIGVLLESTFRILLILNRIQGPALDAADSFITFALNAYNTYINVQNKIDLINKQVAHAGKDFNPALPISKEDFVTKVEEKGKESGTVPATVPTTPVKPNPNEATDKVPIATDVKPVKTPVSGPVKPGKVAVKTGGRRKKRRKKTKKRNQKKRTNRKSKRRK